MGRASVYRAVHWATVQQMGTLTGLALTPNHLWVATHGDKDVGHLRITPTRPGRSTCHTVSINVQSPGNLCQASAGTIYVPHQRGAVLAEYDRHGNEIDRVATAAPAKFIDANRDVIVLGSPRRADGPCIIQTVSRATKEVVHTFTLRHAFIESLCLMDSGNILVSHCDKAAPFGHALEVFSPSGQRMHTLPVDTEDAVWETRVHRFMDGRLLVLNITWTYAKHGWVFDPLGRTCLGRVDFELEDSVPTVPYVPQESFTSTCANRLVVGVSDSRPLEKYFITQPLP